MHRIPSPRICMPCSSSAPHIQPVRDLQPPVCLPARRELMRFLQGQIAPHPISAHMHASIQFRSAYPLCSAFHSSGRTTQPRSLPLSVGRKPPARSSHLREPRRAMQQPPLQQGCYPQRAAVSSTLQACARNLCRKWPEYEQVSNKKPRVAHPCDKRAIGRE